MEHLSEHRLIHWRGRGRRRAKPRQSARPVLQGRPRGFVGKLLDKIRRRRGAVCERSSESRKKLKKTIPHQEKVRSEHKREEIIKKEAKPERGLPEQPAEPPVPEPPIVERTKPSMEPIEEKKEPPITTESVEDPNNPFKLEPEGGQDKIPAMTPEEEVDFPPAPSGMEDETKKIE